MTTLSHHPVASSSEAWRAEREEHERRLAPLLEEHLRRRAAGVKHPVYDFLFDYYAFSPGALRRWTPGWGRVLLGATRQDFPEQPWLLERDGAVQMDPVHLPLHRATSLAWVRNLLRNVAARTPRFSCLGLHEWAMVYRSTTVRHGALPLRLPPAEVAAYVESQVVCCSHYDAFRFFTPEARPLNRLQPVRGAQPELDQSGCLHVNMDLYKWAHKFHPWVGSALIRETFLLARRIREVDMRASPYDVRLLGFEPILLEHPEGREEYVRLQSGFTEEAQPLRIKLLDALDQLAGALARP